MWKNKKEDVFFPALYGISAEKAKEIMKSGNIEELEALKKAYFEKVKKERRKLKKRERTITFSLEEGNYITILKYVKNGRMGKLGKKISETKKFK